MSAKNDVTAKHRNQYKSIYQSVAKVKQDCREVADFYRYRDAASSRLRKPKSLVAYAIGVFLKWPMSV
jgi:hypothetical protein